MGPKGLGWIIVDSLDTLMLMNLTSRLSHAREWLTTSLDYDQNNDVSTFETTIRMLGGLLAAHYLSTAYPDLAPIADDDLGAPGEDLYLEKASDLAGRLLGAFESKTGIPYADVNLITTKGKPSIADSGASSTAEAATLQLEFKYLAKLTGEKHFWDKAEQAIRAIDNAGARDGLVPIFIFADKGQFKGDNIRLGSRGDSYYGKHVSAFEVGIMKLTVFRISHQAILANIKAGAHLSRLMGGSPSRSSKASHHLFEALESCCPRRAAQWLRRTSVSKDGSFGLFYAWYHRPCRHRWRL
jgi:hypothetical protein